MINAVYPVSARQSGIEGDVIVKALVDAEGQVQQVEVSRTSGHVVLDEAAADAAKQLRFRPAVDEGCRVQAWIQMPLRFRAR